MAQAGAAGSLRHWPICTLQARNSHKGHNPTPRVGFRQLNLELGNLSRVVAVPSQVRGARIFLRSRGGVVCAVGDGDSRSVSVSPELPTQEDIVAAARATGISLAFTPTGPLFVVTAKEVGTDAVLGTAYGFVKPWIGGPILHLDSIQLTKASATRSTRTIFGAGVYMGAIMVRHGIDRGCAKGELLAINDSPEYHRKLVRYYTRLGWHPVHEVKGDTWGDYVHMLVWGGVGTRMDADLQQLLGKWVETLTPSTKPQATVQS